MVFRAQGKFSMAEKNDRLTFDAFDKALRLNTNSASIEALIKIVGDIKE